jgi:hypothetical protein
MDFSKSVLFF